MSLHTMYFENTIFKWPHVPKVLYFFTFPYVHTNITFTMPQNVTQSNV